MTARQKREQIRVENARQSERILMNFRLQQVRRKAADALAELDAEIQRIREEIERAKALP